MRTSNHLSQGGPPFEGMNRREETYPSSAWEEELDEKVETLPAQVNLVLLVTLRTTRIRRSTHLETAKKVEKHEERRVPPRVWTQGDRITWKNVKKMSRGRKENLQGDDLKKSPQ